MNVLFYAENEKRDLPMTGFFSVFSVTECPAVVSGGEWYQSS